VTEFEKTLEDIDRRCRKHRVPYAIVGGIAAIIHGSFRVTGDIDVTILTEIDQLDRVLKIFSDDYISRQPRPLAFFQRCFFVPLQHRITHVRVDVTAALSGFERLVIQRSQRLIFENVEVNACTIEDLIIMKLVAARPKDVADLQILIPQKRKALDLTYLHARAKEFIAVERSDVPERLKEFLNRKK
jgi:hypothetical protein